MKDALKSGNKYAAMAYGGAEIAMHATSATPFSETCLGLVEAGVGLLPAGGGTMEKGGFISLHDSLIARKIAWVLTGGGLPAGTEVSEGYLLDLERESFLSLCGEEKTRQRI